MKYAPTRQTDAIHQREINSTRLLQVTSQRIQIGVIRCQVPAVSEVFFPNSKWN